MQESGGGLEVTVKGAGSSLFSLNQEEKPNPSRNMLLADENSGRTQRVRVCPTLLAQVL